MPCRPYSDISSAMASDDDDDSKKLKINLPTTLESLKRANDQRRLEHEARLPPNYQVKLQDVICGKRGSKETSNHVGNERLRVVVEMKLDRYRRSTRSEKSEIVREIVDIVRAYGGRFVRKTDEGGLVDIGNQKSREKVGHAIRGALRGYKLSEQVGSYESHVDATLSSSVLHSGPSSAAALRNQQAKAGTKTAKAEQYSAGVSKASWAPTFEEFLKLEDELDFSSKTKRRAPQLDEAASTDQNLVNRKLKRSKLQRKHD